MPGIQTKVRSTAALYLNLRMPSLEGEEVAASLDSDEDPLQVIMMIL